MVQIKNCMMCGTNIESLQLGCRSKQKRFCTICLSIRKKYNGNIIINAKVILIKIIAKHKIVKIYILLLLYCFLFIKKFFI